MSQKLQMVIKLISKGMDIVEKSQKNRNELDIKAEANETKIKEIEIKNSTSVIEILMNEDAEFAKALASYEEKEISALLEIIKDESIPEELRMNAVKEIIRMASSTNTSKEDSNKRKNNKSNVALIGVLVQGTCFAIPVLISTVEKIKNMGTRSYKIGRAVKNIL